MLPARVLVLRRGRLGGALDLVPLQPLREDGHAVGSLDPLRPFPTALPASAFFDATIAIDASDAALLAMLSALAHAIGARPKHVAAGERAAYHAAAVMASSYVVVLPSRRYGCSARSGGTPMRRSPHSCPCFAGRWRTSPPRVSPTR